MIKETIEDWSKWIFRSIASICLVLIYAEAREIKQDVRTLMGERSGNSVRLGRLEKDIEKLEQKIGR